MIILITTMIMIFTIMMMTTSAPASAEGCAISEAENNLQPLTDTAAGGRDDHHDHDNDGDDHDHGFDGDDNL